MRLSVQRWPAAVVHVDWVSFVLLLIEAPGTVRHLPLCLATSW